MTQIIELGTVFLSSFTQLHHLEELEIPGA